MTINERIESARVEQLIDWWNLDEPPAWASSTHLFFDKVVSALRRVGPEGVKFLKTQAEGDLPMIEDARRVDGSTRKKYLAINSLASRKIADEDVISYILAAFQNEHPAWKGSALGWFVSIEHFPLNRSEVERLLTSGGELQAEAMLYLTHAHPMEAGRMLGEGLRSPEKWVRGKACAEAGFRNIRELRPQVARLLNDQDAYVARSAQIGIEMLDLRDRYPGEWPVIDEDEQ